MKKSYLFLLSVIVSLVSGCESSNGKSASNESPATTATEEQVVVETKKPIPVQHQADTLEKKQPLDVIPKHNVNPPHSEAEKKPESSVETGEAKKLDLSVPIKMQETKTFDNKLSNEKRDYLPDLFASKKEKKQLQIDGTLIKKEEEEVGKDRIVDGVGINFKLTE
jgi:hypothetical protein